ncbi:MAG: sugar nucleotide-binding protein, partial [Bacteroidia bacterium]|nr:sugar nucleotide-binding protein [Bacteroidia bacterium]
ILRVSALYGVRPCRAKNGLNFVQLMLKKASENADLKVVSDEFVSPTSTESIAKITPHLAEINLHGIVHLTSEGSCSWYEFAKEIFSYSGLNPSLSEAKSSDFPGKTPRPKYSVLENARLKSIDTMQMPDWKSSLHHYLNQIKN